MTAAPSLVSLEKKEKESLRRLAWVVGSLEWVNGAPAPESGSVQEEGGKVVIKLKLVDVTQLASVMQC